MSVITSKYHADNILAWEAGTQMPAPPADLYLGLLTAMPTRNDGTGLAEATGTGYARLSIAPAQWAAITTAGDNVTEQTSNNLDLTYPAPGAGGWGTAVGVALFDAASAGHWLRAFSMPAQVITAGANVTVPLGNIVRQVV